MMKTDCIILRRCALLSVAAVFGCIWCYCQVTIPAPWWYIGGFFNQSGEWINSVIYLSLTCVFAILPAIWAWRFLRPLYYVLAIPSFCVFLFIAYVAQAKDIGLSWHSTNTLTVGFLAIASAFAPAVCIISAIRYWIWFRALQAKLKGNSCQLCGYDLRASTGRCPECGATKIAVVNEYP